MKEKIMYAFIVVLLIACGFLTYKVVTNKNANAPEEKGSTSEKVVFKKIETKGDKIVQTFETKLNGTSKTIEVEFKYQKNEVSHSVAGYLSGALVYDREYSAEGLIKKTDVFAKI